MASEIIGGLKQAKIYNMIFCFLAVLVGIIKTKFIIEIPSLQFTFALYLIYFICLSLNLFILYFHETKAIHIFSFILTVFIVLGSAEYMILLTLASYFLVFIIKKTNYLRRWGLILCSLFLSVFLISSCLSAVSNFDKPDTAILENKVSPDGRYVAQVIWCAGGGAISPYVTASVEVFSSNEINYMFSSEVIKIGRYKYSGEFYHVTGNSNGTTYELDWKDNNTLLIDGKEYIIK